MKNQSDKHRLYYLLPFVFVFIVSCGGPYKTVKINQPSSKLKIADELYAKGNYDDAALEYKDYFVTFAGDERCDYAQFRLAECYRMNKEYPLAAVEYRVLINDYGYSEYVDDAFFLEGLCFFQQSVRVEKDQTKTFEAKTRIERFLRLFPNSARQQEAENLLKEVNTKLAEKKFMSARLYYSLGHYKAALIYFNKTIDLYEGTIAAAKSHYFKGKMFEERKEVEEAISEYEKMISSGMDIKEKNDAKKRLELLKKGKDEG
ncbi:outer membrane protein assembly factor BamD [bacterium]|nr:outer membrane protein assembly factor BamD [bacterium]